VIDDLISIAASSRTGDGFRSVQETSRVISERVASALGYGRVVIRMLPTADRDADPDPGWSAIIEAGESGIVTAVSDLRDREDEAALSASAGIEARAALFAPMIAHGRLLGILGGFDTEPHEHSRAAVEQFSTAARLAAIALDIAATARRTTEGEGSGRERHEFDRLNEVQSALAALSLESGGDFVHAITDLLASSLETSILVWDALGSKTRAYTGDIHFRSRISDLLGARDPAQLRALTPGSTLDSATVYPIGRERTLGLLLLDGTTDGSAFTEGVIRYSVGLLAYDLESERADHAARNVSRPSILHALVTGRLSSRQANDVGTFVDATGQPLRIGFLSVDDAVTATAISHRLNFSARARGCLAAAAEKDGVLLMVEDADLPKLRTVLEGLLSFVTQGSWSLGVSEPFVELDGAKAALEQAHIALASAEPHQISFYDEIGPTAALLKYLPPGAVASFVDELLRPLIDYDQHRGGALVDTLGAYLRHRGSLRKAADELYVHSNTIQLRLARVSQLTGIDLHDLRQLGVLSLAFAWRTNGETRSPRPPDSQ
jgi:hypothetical protein